MRPGGSIGAGAPSWQTDRRTKKMARSVRTGPFSGSHFRTLGEARRRELRAAAAHRAANQAEAEQHHRPSRWLRNAAGGSEEHGMRKTREIVARTALQAIGGEAGLARVLVQHEIVTGLHGEISEVHASGDAEAVHAGRDLGDGAPVHRAAADTYVRERHQRDIWVVGRIISRLGQLVIAGAAGCTGDVTSDLAALRVAVRDGIARRRDRHLTGGLSRT